MNCGQDDKWRKEDMNYVERKMRNGIKRRKRVREENAAKNGEREREREK